MKKTVWAVKGNDWRNCPECKGETVQASINGYQVEGVSTDLFFCCDCKAFYVVFPDWYFKGRGKARKLAEFPKNIEIDISDSTKDQSDLLLVRFEKTKLLFAKVSAEMERTVA